MIRTALNRIGGFLGARNGWRMMGSCIPAKPGQTFDLRIDDGDELHGLVAGKATDGLSSKGFAFSHNGEVNGNRLLRHFGFFTVTARITHYRLHKPAGITAQEETRALRENEWRNWAANPNPDAVTGPEGPIRLPEKERT